MICLARSVLSLLTLFLVTPHIEGVSFIKHPGGMWTAVCDDGKTVFTCHDGVHEGAPQIDCPFSMAKEIHENQCKDFGGIYRPSGTYDATPYEQVPNLHLVPSSSNPLNDGPIEAVHRPYNSAILHVYSTPNVVVGSLQEDKGGSQAKIQIGGVQPKFRPQPVRWPVGSGGSYSLRGGGSRFIPDDAN